MIRPAQIERLWLRRLVMVVSLPVVTFSYLFMGLRQMAFEFKHCWTFKGV